MLSPCCVASRMAISQSRLWIVISPSSSRNPITSSPGIGRQWGQRWNSLLGSEARYASMAFLALYVITESSQSGCGWTSRAVKISTTSPRCRRDLTEARKLLRRGVFGRVARGWGLLRSEVEHGGLLRQHDGLAFGCEGHDVVVVERCGNVFEESASVESVVCDVA